MLRMGQNEFLFSLDDFLNENGGLCREERQYALFLYNRLCREDKDIIKKILPKEEEVKIKNVFYEATLMRDFFCADRKCRLLKNYDKEKCWELSDQLIKNKLDNKVKNEDGSYEKMKYKDVEVTLEKQGDSFNEKLVRFLVKKYNDNNNPIKQCEFYINRNFGTNKFSKKKDDKVNVIASVAKAMMNAKPDIAVWYEYMENKTKLLFLECKYCSDESSYEDIMECLEKLGEKDTNSKGQIAIQKLICEFLCEGLFGGSVEACEPKIIRFGSEENDSGSEIPIAVKNIL